MAVSHLINSFDDSDTRDQISQFLKDECDKVLQPSFASECKNYIDQNFGKIMDKIKSEFENNENLSPDSICEKVGVCVGLNSSKLDF